MDVAQSFGTRGSLLYGALVSCEINKYKDLDADVRPQSTHLPNTADRHGLSRICSIRRCSLTIHIWSYQQLDLTRILGILCKSSAPHCEIDVDIYFDDQGGQEASWVSFCRGTIR